jgi:tetraacyldisaccharide 4'-kinase
MLARQLPGVVIVTSADRYLAGRLAEHHLGATVHLLDDGFQHFQVDRDVDIVLVSSADLTASTFPSGRLREPPDVLVAADAIVALDEFEPTGLDAEIFRATGTTAPPLIDGDQVTPASAFVVAGIARPDEFIADVRRHGIAVAGSRTFADHHAFTARDVSAIVTAARAASADVVLTTEKDYVRLLPHRPFPMPIGYLPLTMRIEPPEAFRRWLATSIAAVRDIFIT